MESKSQGVKNNGTATGGTRYALPIDDNSGECHGKGWAYQSHDKRSNTAKAGRTDLTAYRPARMIGGADGTKDYKNIPSAGCCRKL